IFVDCKAVREKGSEVATSEAFFIPPPSRAHKTCLVTAFLLGDGPWVSILAILAFMAILAIPAESQTIQSGEAGGGAMACSSIYDVWRPKLFISDNYPMIFQCFAEMRRCRPVFSKMRQYFDFALYANSVPWQAGG